jgi:hypothetical protein
MCLRLEGTFPKIFSKAGQTLAENTEVLSFSFTIIFDSGK